ncbi:methyltransferase domain-containing protein [Meiothermus sp.]|uniref:class I SAM-dependent methyltransferase n=1 Tax=Meiothermus sp. TaxID=1955249 RepID=UPI00307D4615
MSKTPWDAHLYQDKHAFVWKMGVPLLELLNPQAGERILHVGCGTGQLTAQIAQTGASVVGLDLDEAMLLQARSNYPHLEFVQGNAASFRFAEPFDAVFSNAALHWVLDAEGAVRSMAAALKPGGRLVAELGGQGNVQHILEAASFALVALGYGNRFRNLWYFPSIPSYTALLEKHGLHVRLAQLIDRPTPLEGPDGLKNWFHMFFAKALSDLPTEGQARFFELVEERARPMLWQEDHWIADYVRLRIVAEKT